MNANWGYWSSDWMQFRWSTIWPTGCFNLYWPLASTGTGKEYFRSLWNCLAGSKSGCPQKLFPIRIVRLELLHLTFLVHCRADQWIFCKLWNLPWHLQSRWVWSFIFFCQFWGYGSTGRVYFWHVGKVQDSWGIVWSRSTRTWEYLCRIWTGFCVSFWFRTGCPLCLDFNFP